MASAQAPSSSSQSTAPNGTTPQPPPTHRRTSSSSSPHSRLLPKFPNTAQLLPPVRSRLPSSQLFSTPNTPTTAGPQAPPTHLYTRLPPHLLKATEPPTPDYPRLITLSAPLIRDLIKPTALTPAPMLSARLGCSILFKREDAMTDVFSFKVRGAYNMMRSLTPDERWKGVVACSAGNHAQGVALAGLKLGIASTIVMPLGTPEIKSRNVSRLGAKVVLHGQDFDEAKRECVRLAETHGLAVIPPFDEPYVIAGQGTVGLEILESPLCAGGDGLEAIFVSVGGGGLLAGIAAYIKSIAPPSVKVIGVETFDADAMTKSLEKGERVLLNEVGLFSDGTAVRLVGEETFRLCREYVDGMVLVGTDEICAAVKDVFEDTRCVPEPAGALAVAGMKTYIQSQNLLDSGKKFVAVTSGANMNFDRLRFVAERAALGEKKEVLLSVVIPERPGSFIALHNHIHPRAITEFSYRYSSASRAYIFLSFNLSAPLAGRQAELQDVLEGLKGEGFQARDISSDEFAKTHARYMVGGRRRVPNERIFRFEFPERPGALRKFLLGISGKEGAKDGEGGWNISMFHYRGHGSDLGKVLVGIQVKENEVEEKRFAGFLDGLGYSFVEETDNEVYREFLVGDEDENGVAQERAGVGLGFGKSVNGTTDQV